MAAVPKRGKGWKKGSSQLDADLIREWVKAIDDIKDAASGRMTDKSAISDHMRRYYERDKGYSHAKAERLIAVHVGKYQIILSRYRVAQRKLKDNNFSHGVK